MDYCFMLSLTCCIKFCCQDSVNQIFFQLFLLERHGKVIHKQVLMFYFSCPECQLCLMQYEAQNKVLENTQMLYVYFLFIYFVYREKKILLPRDSRPPQITEQTIMTTAITLNYLHKALKCRAGAVLGCKAIFRCPAVDRL